MTVYSNPRYYKGPLLELEDSVSAKDSQTWQAGQFVRRTDSGIVLCKSNASSIQGLTASTQATATSSSKVPINWIPSSQTQLVIFATVAGVDTKAVSTVVGSNEGLAVNSCICTLSTGNDSTEVLHVVARYADKETSKTSHGSDTADVPGAYIVTIPDSVLTAEGAGL